MFAVIGREKCRRKIFRLCMQVTVIPVLVAEWLTHLVAMCSKDGPRSVARVQLIPGASAYQRIISNNSYAHSEQRVDPRQVRGFDGVLYKL